MPKTKISEFSATPANNTDIDSINIAEGCAPSGINDAIRELMAQLKDFQTGAVGDSFNGPIGTSTAAAGAFTTLSASSTATLSGLTASTALALDASKNIVSVTNTGTGSNVLATSPTLVTPILGTPTSATLTNATGLPIATGVSGLGTGVATFLATPSSANLAAALTDETGSGANVFATSPTLVTPILGTPTSATLTNATGLPLTTGVTGTLPTANGGTNLTSFTSGGVVYASSSSALATGSDLTFSSGKLAVGNFQFYRDATNGNCYVFDTTTAPYSGPMIFGTTNAERMRIDISGNVGIGTSSPAYKLDIAGGHSRIRGAYAQFWFNSDDTNYVDIYNSGATGANNGVMAFETNGSIKMRLDASGNLGLGVTPSAWDGVFKAFDVGQAGNGISGNSGTTELTQAAYYNSGWKYSVSSTASAKYELNVGTHQWFIAPSGTAGNAISFTQAMTLDASGNLLVGGTSSYAGKFQSWGAVTANAGTPNISAIDTTSMASGVGGELAFIGQYTSGGYAYMGSIRGIKENGTDNNTACALTFYTRPTGTAPIERARIDSSGNLLVGTTDSSATSGNGLKVTSGSGNADSVSVVTGATTNAGLTTYQLYSTGAGAYRFYVGAGGTIFATSIVITAISDQRLKENIRDIDTGLDAIMALKPRRFDWKDGKGQDKKDAAGFIAQEYRDIFPASVSETKAGSDGIEYLTMNHEELIPSLVKAIQELKAEFDAYKASHP